MKVDEIYDKIVESISEDTTSAAISYIPSGFDNVKSAVNALYLLKKQWKIDILENESDYDVKFEDKLHVKVPKEYYNDFKKKFKIESNKFDAEKHLQESIEEATTDLKSDLISELTSRFNGNRYVEQSLKVINSFKVAFGETSSLPLNKYVAIDLSDYDSSITKFVESLESVKMNDTGGLEQAVDAIADGRSLNDISIFSDYKYLGGARLKSGDLILEVAVDLSMIARHIIRCNNSDLNDALQDERSFKVVGSLIYPIGNMFSVDSINEIKEKLETI